MRRVPALLTVAGLMGLVVVSAAPARTAAEDGTAGGHAAQSATLTGKVWVLSLLRGKPPLRATELTSEFTTGGKVFGSAGCNRYSGSYAVSGSSFRVSSPLASTRKTCVRAVEQQDAGFLKALTSARSYGVSGAKLTLKSAAGKTLLTYKAQPQRLAGTSWTVSAYNNGKQGVESVLAGTKLTAVFGKDGSLSGFAGCNNYNGPYKATAPKLTIGPLASTQMHCAEPAGVSDQEADASSGFETGATGLEPATSGVTVLCPLVRG
jgi:heat shock protein HslJ